MYEKMTERARTVLTLANQEAIRFSHENLGSEHILLGLIKEGTGVASAALRDFMVCLKLAREKVAEVSGIGPENLVTIGRLPQTPCAKRALENALAESEALGDRCVGTEHLLLALLKDEKCAAFKVIIKMGITPEDLRKAVLDLLDKPNGDSVYENWTDRARKVMQFAIQEAKALECTHVGTEHVLLGLAREGSGVATQALKSLGLDLRRISAKVAEVTKYRSQDIGPANLPQSDNVKRVVAELAAQEARIKSDKTVDAEHLLLALMLPHGCTAYDVVLKLGVSPACVRAEISNILAHGCKVAAENSLEPQQNGLQCKPFIIKTGGEGSRELADFLASTKTVTEKMTFSFASSGLVLVFYRP